MGNQQGKLTRGAGDTSMDDQGGGLGTSPVGGSPLTYSPQLPMDPFPGSGAQPINAALASKPGPRGRAGGERANENLQQVSKLPTEVQEFHGVAGWPAQPTLVPTVIVWSHGGNHIEVEGSFDNWMTRQPLQRSGRDFTIVKLLLPGVYQYKFIVDGEWKYAPDQPAVYDNDGNVNNVLEVQEYSPDNLDSLSSFEPPPSPPSSYNNAPPALDDYQKEPSAMPNHLNLTLLNVPPTLEAPTVLPRPQHVILNHVYEEKAPKNVHALVLGTTFRYKSKYITTCLYKPSPRQDRAGGGLAQA